MIIVIGILSLIIWQIMHRKQEQSPLVGPRTHKESKQWISFCILQHCVQSLWTRLRWCLQQQQQLAVLAAHVCHWQKMIHVQLFVLALGVC